MHGSEQRGFSLVEMMVALVLGVILTSGVISVYLTSKRTYNVNNALGQVQDSGRFALGFMRPLINMAGYTGCSRTQASNGFIDSNLSGETATTNRSPLYNFGQPVYGYEASGTGIGDNATGTETDLTGPTPPQDASLWTPNLDYNDATVFAAIKAKALAGSDIFMVHAEDASPIALTDAAGTYDDRLLLYLKDASGFQAGQIAVVSNCQHLVDSFQITDVDTTANTLEHADGGTTPGNDSVAAGASTADYLKDDFSSTGGSVGLVRTYVFFVGKGVDNSPALYQATLDNTGALGTVQELVSGVENMQVLYGVDTDSDQIANIYETADSVDSGGAGSAQGGLWNSVVSVRVALVLYSDDNAVDAAPPASTTYMLGTTASNSFSYVPPSDKRLRRYFVETFSVRNVLP